MSVFGKGKRIGAVTYQTNVVLQWEKLWLCKLRFLSGVDIGSFVKDF